MDSLTLSVLESKESDYSEFQRLREGDLSAQYSQPTKADWKRLKASKLNDEEQATLNRLRREKYDRLFSGVGLEDLKALAIANTQDAKAIMTEADKRDFEREYEQRGETAQEAYLLLLDLLPRDKLNEEQSKNHKMLRLISF